MTEDSAAGDKSTDGVLADKRSIDAVTEGLADEGLMGTTDEVLIDNELTEGLLTDEELRKGEGPTDEQELADDELTEGRTEELTDEGRTGKEMAGKVLTDDESTEAKRQRTGGEMAGCLTDGRLVDDEAGVDEVFCNCKWILIPPRPILGPNSFPVIALMIRFEL